MKTITTGLVHNTNDFLPRAEQGEFIRASGDCICSHCGKEYRKHPMDPYEKASTGEPFMRVLCDNTRVKL